MEPRGFLVTSLIFGSFWAVLWFLGFSAYLLATASQLAPATVVVLTGRAAVIGGVLFGVFAGALFRRRTVHLPAGGDEAVAEELESAISEMAYRPASGGDGRTTYRSSRRLGGLVGDISVVSVGDRGETLTVVGPWLLVRRVLRKVEDRTGVTPP